MEGNPILKNPLSLDSEVPLYSQLMGIIKRSITAGALKVGDLLPSEAELCRAYDISRNTVRQAIGALEEEGFVVRNVFEQALDDAQRTRIEEIKRDLLAHGARAAAMTGSGSAVFGLFPDEASCRAACGAVQCADVQTFCTEFV